MSFVHLHAHSHYSLLDGLSKIDEMIDRTTELNLPAAAVTDHGVMYGLVEFYQKAKAAGIKPILGVEAYVARGNHRDTTSTSERPYHLTVLARTLQGYRNLIKLTTIAHHDGYYYKPRVDMDLLEQYGEGLTILTGCLGGELAQLLLGEKHDQAEALLQRYQKIAGAENVFVEVQSRPTLPNQATANERLFALADRLKIPVVATNDSHYARLEDATAQDILLCVQTKRKLNDDDRMTYQGEDLSLRDPKSMQESFPDRPDVIANTLHVAESVDCEIPLRETKLPHYNVPKGATADESLLDLCERGIPVRYADATPEQMRAVRERLDYELDIIKKTGYASYFLIVQDFINWAKNEGIVVGPGRGSAAGSIVAYLTNITNIDPLKYDLLFERFLNPERISMPDIDVDFADERRDEVLRYVEKKYGKDHVAQIITFGTMAARAAVRDVGRVMDLSYSYCDRVAKLIPMFTKLDDAIREVPELKEIYENDDEARKLLDNARKLEGVVRHASTHACGVVITKDPLDNDVATQHASNNDDSVITQYDLHAVEDLGLLKMDFLGLKNLTILQNAIMYIEKVRGEHIDIDTIPLDNKKTYKVLKDARTTGVFQLEGAGMKRYLKQLKPTEFEDIIAMVSLYRPGPMEFIPVYIDGKHGRRESTYLHPKLKPILEKTYGVAIYQEQVLQVARDLAGFTLGEADVLRKAVGKKIVSLLNEQREKFIAGCVKNGIDQATAEHVFAFIEPFARYGFNRAHAACYALIAYQTAYFKANYPAEFMAALLSSDEENTDRIAIEVNECRAMGIEVLPPDVNESYSTFTVVKSTLDTDRPRIRFGLNAIKNVGSNVVKTIIHERKENGPYRSIEDFLTRCADGALNKKSLESLIMSGALTPFGDRRQLLDNIDQLLAYAKTSEQERTSGQSNIFRMLPAEQAPTLTLRPASSESTDEHLAWEKALLGLYVSDHPFSRIASQLPSSVLSLHDALDVRRGNTITAGVITGIQKIMTKTSEQMLFVRIEDMTTSVETLVFPSVLKDTEDVWQEDRTVLIEGRISERGGARNIICNRAMILPRERITETADAFARNAPPPPVDIAIPTGTTRDTLDTLKILLARFPGNRPVRLIIDRDGKRQAVATKVRVRPSSELTQSVRDLFPTGSSGYDTTA